MSEGACPITACWILISRLKGREQQTKPRELAAGAWALLCLCGSKSRQTIVVLGAREWDGQGRHVLYRKVQICSVAADAEQSCMRRLQSNGDDTESIDLRVDVYNIVGCKAINSASATPSFSIDRELQLPRPQSTLTYP